LYNRVVFGTLKTTYIARFTEANRRETAILLVLLVSMAILGVTADGVLNLAHVPVKAMLFVA
jgi:NADH:ubiquinone oxidoreductase subunit 4 (subunit M)